jgi:hypothetical protein
MKHVLACGLAIGIIWGASTSASFAQQKTVKACIGEWRANKAANQANHITEKAYVAQCRAGAVQSAPTPRQSPAPAPQEPSRPPAPAPEPTPAPSPRKSAALERPFFQGSSYRVINPGNCVLA